MAEYSLVGLSSAVCGAEPIVPWFSARLCYEADRVSDEADCVPDIVSEACSRSCYSCSEVRSLR